MLSCSNAVVYTYDLALGCFTKLADRWWAEGSDAWGWGKQRTAAGSGGGGGGGGTGAGGKGLVAYVEGYCNNTPVESPTTTTTTTAATGGTSVNAVTSGASNDNEATAGEKPQWWTEALTLGHLETRMYAAKMLDSPVEYKQALLTYARRIADEGFRWKAEELIRELFGPIYWCVCRLKPYPFFIILKLISDDCRRPGRDDGWTPTVAGLGKRDLLKEVLSIFGAFISDGFLMRDADCFECW